MKTWLGSRGFVTVIKLVVELPLVLGSDDEVEATLFTLMESSSISPLILGRRRAAILTLWIDIVVGGKEVVMAAGSLSSTAANWLGGNKEQISETRNSEKGTNLNIHGHVVNGG